MNEKDGISGMIKKDSNGDDCGYADKGGGAAVSIVVASPHAVDGAAISVVDVHGNEEE